MGRLSPHGVVYTLLAKLYCEVDPSGKFSFNQKYILSGEHTPIYITKNFVVSKLLRILFFTDSENKNVHHLFTSKYFSFEIKLL